MLSVWRELSAGHPCPLPACLAGPCSPGDTGAYICSPEAHARPHLLRPGHGPLLPLAGSCPCTLHCLGCHTTALAGRGARVCRPLWEWEAHPVPLLALRRRALVGDPFCSHLVSSLLGLNGRNFCKLRFLVPTSGVYKLLFVTLCTLVPPHPFPAWLHTEEAT